MFLCLKIGGLVAFAVHMSHFSNFRFTISQNNDFYVSDRMCKHHTNHSRITTVLFARAAPDTTCCGQ